MTEEETDEAEPVLLLRVEDAAKRLGIRRTMMYRLLRIGEIESVRVGRLRRVPLASLEQYVEVLRRNTSMSA